MPKGNVGTSLSTFMALIQACKLPAHLIKKLQLEFPKSRSSKKYGAVAFEYELRRHGGIIECGGSRDGTGRIVRKGVGGESVSGGDGDVTADGMQDGVDADMHNVGACGDDVRKDGGRGEDNSANDGGRCEENSEDDADDGIPSVSVFLVNLASQTIFHTRKGERRKWQCLYSEVLLFITSRIILGRGGIFVDLP